MSKVEYHSPMIVDRLGEWDETKDEGGCAYVIESVNSMVRKTGMRGNVNREKSA